MAVPSNPKLSDIQTEFGGSNPIELTEYYSGGPLVPATTPCLLYTSPSPRDRQKSRMPSSA